MEKFRLMKRVVEDLQRKKLWKIVDRWGLKGLQRGLSINLNRVLLKYTMRKA